VPGPGHGQLAAELLVAGQRRVLVAPSPLVQLEDGAPHVAGGAQQPEQPVPLGAGDPQPAPGGAVHHRRRVPLTFSRHEPMKASPTDKTTPPATNHSPTTHDEITGATT
jgi:hypothetical protein